VDLSAVGFALAPADRSPHTANQGKGFSPYCIELYTVSHLFVQNVFNVADPESGAFFDFWIWDPGSGMGKTYVSGSGMNNPDNLSESL
jgi:hypothetical protein